MQYVKKGQALWFRMEESWRVAIVAFLAARLFYALWSAIILFLQPIAIQYDTNANQPIVVFFDLRTNQTFAYLNEVDGTLLKFRSNTDNTVSDLQTNTRWNIISGRAIDDFFQKKELQAVPVPLSMFPYVQTKPYPIAWLAMWQRFDANWYTSIAEHGYPAIPGGEHFPPFYPMLIRLTMLVFGNAFIAGLIISHLATLLTIKLLYDLCNEWNNTSGEQTVLYFLIFPSSFFLFSAYSESLFLALVLLTFRSMKKRNWAWAGFWIFSATLTRLQGVALGIPLMYLIYQDRPFMRKFNQWMGVVIASAGIFFYFFLRSAVSTDAVIPFAESAWPARLAFPWQTYWYAVQVMLSNRFSYIDMLNLITSTLLFVLLITGWKNLPLEYNLYAAFSFLVVTARIVENQPLSGMLRFTLTLYPVFYTLYLWAENPWRRRLIIYACLTLNLFLSAQFFGWGWVA